MIRVSLERLLKTTVSRCTIAVAMRAAISGVVCR
jgi:hypothetical protein